MFGADVIHGLVCSLQRQDTNTSAASSSSSSGLSISMQMGVNPSFQYKLEVFMLPNVGLCLILYYRDLMKVKQCGNAVLMLLL